MPWARCRRAEGFFLEGNRYRGRDSAPYKIFPGVRVTPAVPKLVTITVDAATRVSALLQRPSPSSWCFVLAHGAGAGMRHPFMVAVADALAARGIASLRYQFPYMERKAKWPDAAQLSHATVRAAVATAREVAPDLPVIAGGKSFGGRMTSQAQALAALAEVRGLAFLGFPLHSPKEPSVARAEHLFQVQIPMLFLQGTRDAFAKLELITPLVERLGARATLTVLQDADHSFHVPARTGRSEAQVRDEMLTALAAWADPLIQNA
jgi:predicted alpha/beta-hydrolase family hydrolase